MRLMLLIPILALAACVEKDKMPSGTEDFATFCSACHGAGGKGDGEAAAVDFVVAHPARFVFVAMGPPQSEKFCQRLIDDGRATGLGLCIGSSINMITGRLPRAPQWMEDRGLVWLYRLAREPGRLWKRYLVRGFYGLGLGLRDAVRFRLRLKTPGHG